MRPASRTNLSFHSSSDYSARPVYLDDDMSAPLTRHDSATGAPSTTVGPNYGSEAFATARSEAQLSPSPLDRLTSPNRRPPALSPTTLQRPNRPPGWVPPSSAPAPPAVAAAASTGTAAAAPAAAAQSSPLPAAAATASPATAPAVPVRADVASPRRRLSNRPASSTFLSPNTPADGSPLSRLENSQPPGGRRGTMQPPAALSRRASSSAAAFRTTTAGDGASSPAQPPPLAPLPAAAPAGGDGWWGQFLQVLRRGAGISSPADTRGTASSGFDGLFDDVDNSPTPRYGAHEPVASMAERVYIPPGNEPFAPLPPMARPVQDITEEEQLLEEATDIDAATPVIEVDLVSALHGYRENPNEAFGHLVAAALASRSPQRPVTGAEIAEADHTPFLVQLIVDSGCLDVSDPLARQQVQETLDRMIPEDAVEVTPALSEYLASFFQVPFVQLTHARYTVLKGSGFQNITLMSQNRHVLPDENFHTILFNYSEAMMWVYLAFMVLSLLATICCTVAIAFALGNWMVIDESGYQNYGFYTLIAFGCGYAIHLILILYITRTMEDVSVYEDTTGLGMPSAYVNVWPVLPLFELSCIVAFIRARRRHNLVAFTHNVVASSRLAGICYAMCFAFPQFAVQSYFNHTSRSVADRYKKQWTFYFLGVSAMAQWGIALIRYAWMVLAYDSIGGFGYARFNVRRTLHETERRPGVVKVLYYTYVFLMESAVYVVVASSIDLGNVTNCVYLPTVIIAVAGVLIFCTLMGLLVILIEPAILVRSSFSSVPIFLLALAVVILGQVQLYDQCTDFARVVFQSGFIFGYIAYGAFFVTFFVWVIFMALIVVLKVCHTDCFPQLT